MLQVTAGCRSRGAERAVLERDTFIIVVLVVAAGTVACEAAADAEVEPGGRTVIAPQAGIGERDSASVAALNRVATDLDDFGSLGRIAEQVAHVIRRTATVLILA